MATKAVVLYDEDFYAWTQQQAQALREHFKGDNRLDVGHLAEEIEDPGRSELQAVESFVEQIIAHLQLDYAAQAGPRAHWRAEVLSFRMSAAPARCRPRSVARSRPISRGAMRRARQIAAVGAMVHEPDLIRRLPRMCPYDGEAVRHRDLMAEAGIDLSAGEDAPKRPGKRKA